jgi:methyl-accepting chemotaxis protein
VYREQNSDGGLHFASLLVGIAAGVVGTIVYATYNERQFNRVVGKTRELSDRSGEYLGDVRDNAMHKTQELVESARHGVESVGNKVHEVVNRVTHSTDKVADKAKGALDT